MPKKTVFITTLCFIVSLFLTSGVLACSPPKDFTGCAIEINPDYILELRGWTKTSGALEIVKIDHPIDDKAPQFTGLIKDNPRPEISNIYKVNVLPHDDARSWATEATMIGLGTTPGQEIQVPPSGYDLGEGYEVMVLYADEDSITLKYTLGDNITLGYTLYIENVQVDPKIVALYEEANAAGRTELPLLSAFQVIGTAIGDEILIAIRDTGAFLDPRWIDWWQKIIEAGIPLPPALKEVLDKILKNWESLKEQPPSGPPLCGDSRVQSVPDDGCKNARGPQAQCNNTEVETGPLRPFPCNACFEKLENLTFSCAQSAVIRQDTWVNFNDLRVCNEKNLATFNRNWKGIFEVNIDETKVPFAGYSKSPTDPEFQDPETGETDAYIRYLAEYFEGVWHFKGEKYDFTKAEDAQKAFREGGVWMKLAPASIQDERKCQKIKDALSGKDENYEVTNGEATFHLSDFSGVLPCTKPETPDLAWLSQYQNWLKTAQGQLWGYVPQFTRKDAAGKLELAVQEPPGKATPNSIPLSFPHLSRLLEVTTEVRKLLMPRYSQGELANLTKTQAQKEEPKLLTAALPVYAQAPPTINIKITDLHYNPETNTIDYKVEGKAGAGHTWISNDPMKPDTKFNYKDNIPETIDLHTTDDTGGALVATSVDAEGNFEIHVYAYNANLSDRVDYEVRAEVHVSGHINPDGTITLEDGQVIEPGKPIEIKQLALPKECCLNIDSYKAPACYNPDALTDDDKNDKICSYPYPATAIIDAPQYVGTITKAQYDKFEDEVNDCIAKYGRDDSRCYWKKYSEIAELFLNRNLGLTFAIPHVEKIGHLTISNFYDYEVDGSHGSFAPDTHQSYTPGIFDIFRTANIYPFAPKEAKSPISYRYTGTYSDSGHSAEQDLMKDSSGATLLDEESCGGNLYYPWLGGVENAKQCVSQVWLLPESEQVKGKIGLCPTSQRPEIDKAGARAFPAASSSFAQEEQAIAKGEKDNPVLPPPELPKIEITMGDLESLRKALKEAGYEDYQLERIIANLPAYLEAEQRTGIPWYVFAAIHGVETAFRTDNPANGFGPMQVTSQYYEPSHQNSFEEFVQILIDTAVVIAQKADYAKAAGFIEADKTYAEFGRDDWAQVAYYYNGRPEEMTYQGEAYYGREENSWQQSGYVTGVPGTPVVWQKDEQGNWQWVEMTGYGFLHHHDRLARINITYSRISY